MAPFSPSETSKDKKPSSSAYISLLLVLTKSLLTLNPSNRSIIRRHTIHIQPARRRSRRLLVAAVTIVHVEGIPDGISGGTARVAGCDHLERLPNYRARAIPDLDTGIVDVAARVVCDGGSAARAKEIWIVKLESWAAARVAWRVVRNVGRKNFIMLDARCVMCVPCAVCEVVSYNGDYMDRVDFKLVLVMERSLEFAVAEGLYIPRG